MGKQGGFVGQAGNAKEKISRKDAKTRREDEPQINPPSSLISETMAGRLEANSYRGAHLFQSGFDAHHEKPWVATPRPRKRGSAPRGVLRFQTREAVGGPIFGADTVVDEEKAGGIVFFFDVF